MPHLWQSTFFALAAALLTLAVRKNRASIRYWLWLSASLKFLIPFALLLNLGRYLETWMPAPRQIAAPAISYTIQQFSAPFFLYSAPSPQPAPDTIHWIPIATLGIWFAGFATVASIRFRGWLRIRAAVRASTATSMSDTVEIRVSSAQLEPGVVGIVRPVLLLPEGIAERLKPSELETVLAHELCHIHRHDNLFATLHMITEAIFWFHPLVWWIGKHLVEERERACDEEVLSQGNHPEVYADAILNICKLYVQSPLPCVSGVSGASIRRRIEAIMADGTAIRLTIVQKSALAVAGMAALAIPLTMGVLTPSGTQAQTAPASRPKFEVASIRRCTEDWPPPAANGGGRRGGGLAATPNTELFRAVCRPVALLIQMAYVDFANGHRLPQGSRGALSYPSIQGGPDWIRSERYTIEARPASPQTSGMMSGPMLQALLEDRFGLKLHRESKEVPAYALVVARGGPRLQQTPTGGCTPGDPDGLPAPVVDGQPLPCGYMGAGENGGVKAVGVPIASFFDLLAPLRRPIVDQTELTGLFDYDFDVAPGPPNGSPQLDDPAYPDTVDALTNALQKFGLKIQPTKGSAPFIVIDHVERPSEN